MADSSGTSEIVKVLVSGSRDWWDWSPIEEELGKIYGKYGKNVMLIHGAARGADAMCGHVARKKQWLEIPMPADWDEYGKRAGLIRNIQMLDLEPDLIVAFRLHGKASRGTTHLINIAREAGYDVKVIESEKDDPKYRKEQKMEISKEELQELIGAAVMAAVGDKAETVPVQRQEARYHETLKDQSGEPLKLAGQGVRKPNGFAQSGCRNCGTGSVAWVEHSTKVYEQGPKKGKPVFYLAQAYQVEGEGIVALAFEPHFRYCVGKDTPASSTQETTDSPSLEEGESGPSIDDKLEADRAETGTFDAFTHAEVNEIGTDVGMGFLAYGSLNDLESHEKAVDRESERGE